MKNIFRNCYVKFGTFVLAAAFYSSDLVHTKQKDFLFFLILLLVGILLVDYFINEQKKGEF